MKMSFPLAYAISFDDDVQGFLLYICRPDDKKNVVILPIVFDTHYEGKKFIERFKFFLLCDMDITRDFAEELVKKYKKINAAQRFKKNGNTLIMGEIAPDIWKVSFERAKKKWDEILTPEEHKFMLEQYIKEIKEDTESAQ